MVESDRYFVQVYFKDKPILTFVDSWTSHDGNGHIFHRKFDGTGTQLSYVQGVINLVTIDKTTKILKSVKPSKTINENIITLDIETINKDNILSAYCISIMMELNINHFTFQIIVM